MRFVSIRNEEGTRPGILEGEYVRLIDAVSLTEYIELLPSERMHRHTNPPLASSGVCFGTPIVPTRNVLCIGRNYPEHAQEEAKIFGSQLRLDVPEVFTKPPSTVVGPDQDMQFDASVSSSYDYEAELGVVIGTRCKNVDEDDWRRIVFGYTCINDVTARDLQRTSSQWFKGKSLDDSCPIGPWIVSSDEIDDPHSLDISLRVNGVQKQRSNTSKMIHRIPRLLAWLSKGMTLFPGDVIATGTPEGVGFARKPPEMLRDGDIIEVEIDKIGILRNRIRITPSRISKDMAAASLRQ